MIILILCTFLSACFGACAAPLGADLTGVSLISADWSLQGETVWETPNYSALMVDAPIHRLNV